jgi:phage shock protein A
MSLFKRLVTTVHSSVDRTLASMENHEAIVDAALRDSREAVSRARVRLARLEKDGQQQRNRITELTTEVELWNERARSVAETDRPKALACIKRRKACEKDLAMAKAQSQEHARIEQRVRDSISESTNRVQALQSQRNQMRSREAAAQAGKIVHSLDGRLGTDVEAAIERWEVTVGEAELLTDTLLPVAVDDVDDLAAEFVTKEENEMLEDELDSLLTKKGERHAE